MKIFITGASGFIGAYVARAALARGHSVLTLTVPGDSLWRLKEIDQSLTKVHGYLSDTEAIKKALKEYKPDACIHLAWYAEPGKYINSNENISCLSDSLSLLGTLIEAGCKTVVYAGTSAEYDDALGYIHEETPTRPKSLYAAAKLSCFLMSEQIASLNNINFAWARIFNPYGPGEDQRRVVSAAILSLLQGKPFAASLGEQVRDYIYVEDIAEAFCLIAEKQACGVYNISSGTPMSIRQLLETIGNLTGHAHLIEFGARPNNIWDPPFVCGDNKKLRELGWQSRFSLTQGLIKTIQWCKDNQSSST